MADETPGREVERVEEQSDYKPKPPLWQSKPEKPMSMAGIAGGAALVVLAVCLFAVLFEGQCLSVPVGQTEATVIRLGSGRAADEHPASFRYLVQLPDGSRHPFICERIHRPGERLMATSTRGRLTGRVRLGAPYAVVAEPPGP